MIKKIIGRRRIDDLPVNVVDKSRTSHRYFQVTEFPRKFTAGKNVIKLRAKGNVLVPDSVIHTEILDSANNPIYHEVLNYVEADGTRIIVVYIYPDTAPGIATVYLAGRATRIRELRSGKIPFSNNPGDPNFKDNPNIKWRRTIPVQPGEQNTSEILFVTASGQSTSYPVVQVSERTVPYLDTVHPSGSAFQTKNGSSGVTFELKASPTTIKQVPDAAALQGQGGAGAPIPFIQSPFGKGVLKYGLFNRLQVNSLSPAIPVSSAAPFIGTGTNSAQSAKQVMQSQMPVEIPGIELPQIHAKGFQFEPDMVGGTIKINAPISIKTPSGVQQITSSYEAKIVKLQNETVANVTKTLDFTYTNPDGSKRQINGFEPTTQWTASYQQIPNFVTTQNSQSYANIVVSNLMPATGDIAKIRVYQRAAGSTGNYKLVNETDVEQQDILIDETTLTSQTGMGDIANQSVINKYWTRTGFNGAGTPSAVHDRSHLMSSMKILPHASGFPNKNSYHTIRLNDTYARTIYKGAPYYIEFDAKSFDNGNTVTPIITKPRIDIYMSGSAFTPPGSTSGTGTPTYFIKDRNLGKHIGTIEGGSGSRFDNIQAHFEPDQTGTGVPIFVIRSGTWQLSELHLYPNRLEGFSPSTTRILIPINIEHMNTAQEFKLKYYDSRGKASKHESKMSGVVFTGANFYIQGGSNLLTGSVFIGNSVGSGIEMAGVSSGFIRSIGYEGFDHAFDGTGGPGFMIYSGSVLPNSGTGYDGVGIELIQNHDNYLRYRTNDGSGNAELDIRTKKFFLGSTSSFISGAGDGTIAISSSNFELSTGGDVTMQGTITAEAGGTIGGFAIGTNDLTATNFSLNTSDKRLTLGSSNDIFIADADEGIQVGNSTFASAPFSVDLKGNLKTNAGSIGGFGIGSAEISSSNLDLRLKSSGEITGSKVLFDGGKIGGFELSATEIKDVNSDLRLKETGEITGSKVLFDGGKIAGWSIDNSTIQKLSSTDTDGIIIDSEAAGITIHGADGKDSFSPGSATRNNVKLALGQISSGIFGIKGFDSSGNDLFELSETQNVIAGWSFDNEKIFNTGVIISASYGFKVTDGTDDGNDFVDIAYRNDSWGIKGRNAGVNIFELGSTNQIAGWTFDNEKLVGGQMIISKDGTIQSDGFVTNLPGSGFRLTAASGGMLEVENARIRGTLSTAVFEKETVNAVGGQLYVANSTVLTSSALHPDPYYTTTDTTMSVVNVTGFTGSYNDDGEILALKKVTDTGFSTEYVLVQSASRNSGDSENDFSGNIYVIRGYTSNAQTSSLGDLVSVAQTYSGSQVLVSTGRPGTGYIRLNANPNDQSTPYMQIVERTGSGVYDLSLKAQVGDLSGITDNRFSDGVKGFGIYTENGYFKGKIEIGSQPSQAPNDKLFLHYNFNGSTNNKIISQTPTLFTGSYSAPAEVNFAVPGAVTITGSSELQGPLAVNANEFTSSLTAGENAFSAGFRLSFASESLDKNVFITRNYPRFVVYKQTNDRINFRIFSGSTDNDVTNLEAVSFSTATDNVIKENDLYHIFVTAKENHSASIDVYNVTSGSYVGGAAAALNFANNGGDHTFGWPRLVSDAGYHEWEHGAPGWAGSNNKTFHGTWHDIRYYKDTALSTSQMEAIVTNTDAASGGTIIDGNSIQTGKIKSSNLGASIGSELDLDAGTIKLGGTQDPLFEVNQAGHVSASAGNIGGVTLGTDKMHIGAGNHNNSDTAFYVDKDGTFSLKDKLVWDGTNLTISGDITVTNTSDFADANAPGGAAISQSVLNNLEYPPGMARGGEGNITFLPNFESSWATINAGEIATQGDFLVTPSGYIATGSGLGLRRTKVATPSEGTAARGLHHLMFSSESLANRFPAGTLHTKNGTANTNNDGVSATSIPFDNNHAQHVIPIRYDSGANGSGSFYIIANSTSVNDGMTFTPTTHDTILASYYHDGTLAMNEVYATGSKYRWADVIPYNTVGGKGINWLKNHVTIVGLNDPLEHVCTTTASLNDDFYFHGLNAKDLYQNQTNLGSGRLPHFTETATGIIMSTDPSIAENTWRDSIVSRRYWKRNTNPKLTVDVKILTAGGLLMIGLGKGHHHSYSYNYYNMYIKNNDVANYGLSDSGGGGTSTNNIATGATSNCYAAGDVLRVEIQVHPKGATGKVFKNGDYNNPIATQVFANRADENLFVRICVDSSGGGAGRYDSIELQRISMGGNTPSTGTKISGNSISTGLIQSNNWSADGLGNGTLLNLDDGILEMRANSAARFKLDSTNNTAVIAGWNFTSAGLTGNGAAYIRTAGSGKRVEINSSDNNIKFYNGSGTNVMTLDDNVLASPAHPGMKITQGTVRVINTQDFGDAGAGAPLFVSAGGSALGSNRCGAFFGISHGITPPYWWTNTAPTITGKRRAFVVGKCPNPSTATKAFHAGVVAEASLGICLSDAADETIMCAYLGAADDGGYSFYGAQGPLYNSGEIRSAADVVAYYSSDERMKDNIFIIEDPINKIKRLRGVSFDWNKETAPDWAKDGEYLPSGSLHDIGVIAQDVQKVFPEAVIERESGYLAVKYEKLVAVLIEGVKEQQKQIEELTDRIDKLENK